MQYFASAHTPRILYASFTQDKATPPPRRHHHTLAVSCNAHTQHSDWDFTRVSIFFYFNNATPPIS